MNRWDELFRMRDEHREQVKNARGSIKFKELEWEVNRQGKMKWYLHPAKKDTGHRAIMMYVQEIPPGSRSGKVKHQGGSAFFIWKGRGYSIINGKKYEWEADDALLLPIDIFNGATYQHFNSDPGNPALLIYAQANTTDSLGVDLGVGFEQLENCPEYEASVR